jgi:hypothetical protein
MACSPNKRSNFISSMTQIILLMELVMKVNPNKKLNLLDNRDQDQGKKNKNVKLQPESITKLEFKSLSDQKKQNPMKDLIMSDRKPTISMSPNHNHNWRLSNIKMGE